MGKLCHPSAQPGSSVARSGAPLPQGLLFGFFASLALAFAFSFLVFCFLPFSLSFLPPLSPIDHLRPVPGAVCSAWKIPRLIGVSRCSAGSARIRKEVQPSEGFVFLISPTSLAHGCYTLTELSYAKKQWKDPVWCKRPRLLDRRGRRPTRPERWHGLV